MFKEKSFSNSFFSHLIYNQNVLAEKQSVDTALIFQTTRPKENNTDSSFNAENEILTDRVLLTDPRMDINKEELSLNAYDGNNNYQSTQDASSDKVVLPSQTLSSNSEENFNPPVNFPGNSGRGLQNSSNNSNYSRSLSSPAFWDLSQPLNSHFVNYVGYLAFGLPTRMSPEQIIALRSGYPIGKIGKKPSSNLPSTSKTIRKEKQKEVNKRDKNKDTDRPIASILPSHYTSSSFVTNNNPPSFTPRR